ncbi:hypothetical protein RHSIM_Rhsim11G0125500 [Rhododendron simsii]|uniref:Uncharacterized protein n=1 Tax=Rhododendron simsii TaxID=118357 RepID=A0A834G902_RHOSS|nr:hypothetical protein RHSIM_Rhsim11G0125500 [Rhododendron simsii]
MSTWQFPRKRGIPAFPKQLRTPFRRQIVHGDQLFLQRERERERERCHSRARSRARRMLATFKPVSPRTTSILESSDALGLGQDSSARHRKSLGIGFALMECPSYSMPRGAGLLRFVTRCLKAIELLQSCCEKCNYNSTHCASVSDLLKQSRRQT